MKVELILRLLTNTQKLLLQRAYPTRIIDPMVKEIDDVMCLINLGFLQKTDIGKVKLTHTGNNLISEILNEST
jgi:hypothetical protein